jgi:multiple sugar transport system ATP-binding protein
MFVAEFVGTPKINFLKCKVELKDKVPSFQYGNSAILGTTELASQLDLRKEYMLGVRPADFYLVDKNEPGALHGKVELVEPLGDDILVHFALQKELFVTKLDAILEEQIGSEIALKVEPQNLHVFDERTEVRVN